MIITSKFIILKNEEAWKMSQNDDIYFPWGLPMPDGTRHNVANNKQWDVNQMGKDGFYPFYFDGFDGPNLVFGCENVRVKVRGVRGDFDFYTVLSKMYTDAIDMDFGLSDDDRPPSPQQFTDHYQDITTGPDFKDDRLTYKKLMQPQLADAMS